MKAEDNLEKAVELINKSTNVLVTTHTRPDGDACGCAVAMAKMLESAGKNATVLLLSELPEWYAFLFDNPPTVMDKDVSIENLKDGSFIQPDLIVIVDTNSRNQLAGFADFLDSCKCPVLVIDHHITNDGLGTVEIIDTSAAAAGLIVFDLFQFSGFEMTEQAAQALFVAIATDTGWFRFTSTDSRVHKTIAELLKKNVDSDKIYHTIYQSFSPERFKLMTAVLNHLSLHFDGRYAEQYLLQKDFEETGAAYKDTENLIDECQKIKTVEVSALFVELKDGRIKCSLRSRSDVDVRIIAQNHGGGGHKQASGLHLDGPLDAAMQAIKSEIEEQIR